MTQELEAQASAILDSLVSTPFNQCISISRAFKNLTASASIYAVRHRQLGLLYVGKTRYSRERFRDGHKAFLWSWLDHYNPEDIRLLLHPLTFIELQTLSSSLEAMIIAAAKPPYNARYPLRD